MDWYHGRIEPEPFHVGQPGERAPTSVSHISGNLIFLSHELEDGTYEDAAEIEFSGSGHLRENEDLFVKLVELNERGMPFQYQPKEMEAPEILMAWWQDMGRIKTSFRLISWYDYHRWHIRLVDLPQIGVGGWAGPKPFGQ
jgi:hypothetical protein